MSSLFNEFSETYERFRKHCPHHPLNEEVRHRILRGRFPTSQWLRRQITQMRNIMAPMWLDAQPSRSGRVEEPTESLTDARSME